MRISSDHQRWLASRGIAKVPEVDGFAPWLRASLGGYRSARVPPTVRWLAVVAGPLFLLANALRWLVMGTMPEHWNVQITDTTINGSCHHGPFRWVRHPVAVFVELVSLPLIQAEWLTTVGGATPAGSVGGIGEQNLSSRKMRRRKTKTCARARRQRADWAEDGRRASPIERRVPLCRDRRSRTIRKIPEAESADRKL